ncbi:RDD family protein [Ferrimonas sediminicola]|nr:RDD family protein [Ferrimonas sediminicola]
MNPTTDPRTIITPYAFKIAPRLLNRPLASPWRRALAMTIDLLMVAILAELPGDMLLAMVLAVAWVRVRGYRIKAKMQTGIFIGFGLWLLFAMVHAALDGWPGQPSEPISGSSAQTVALSGVCDAEDSGCKLRAIADITLKVVSEELATEAQLSAYLVQRYGLMPEQADRLAAQVMADPTANAGAAPEETVSPPPEPAAAPAERRAPTSEEVLDVLDSALERGAEREAETAEEESRFSLIQVARGIIEDLGLGLGWASVYFTVFTAWFHGQTLGKKLLAIRVIQLDNTPLSLWAAFGRYGGYGAGVATGLTGFLQIFWDPNRQGIHDKIASTVVVDLRAKARRRARATSKQILATPPREPDA